MMKNFYLNQLKISNENNKQVSIPKWYSANKRQYLGFTIGTTQGDSSKNSAHLTQINGRGMLQSEKTYLTPNLVATLRH